MVKKKLREWLTLETHTFAHTWKQLTFISQILCRKGFAHNNGRVSDKTCVPCYYMTISSNTTKQFSSPHHYLCFAISSFIMKLTSMEAGHALSNHPPWGCRSPRKRSKSGGRGAACTGVVMDGCAPTPEDDWKVKKDRLQTQMGFDTDSELVPCHLIDGGKREMGEGWNRERGEMEKWPGGGVWSEYTCIMIKEKWITKEGTEKDIKTLCPSELFQLKWKFSWTLFNTLDFLPNVTF